MRAPTRARVRMVTGWLLLCSSSIACGGCATLRATLNGYATGDDGIARPQQRLRDALSRGDFKAALGWHEDDELLRRLDVGIASYYAAQFERSAAVLDSAALLADDRITASLSRDALSMVTSDLARPYQPRRTERLFIPYYAMLAYARLGKWEDAAVEARRISSLLEQYASDRDESERSLHGALHELAGAVFARAGEPGDAAVARRAARALVPAYGADSAAEPRGAADSAAGEVLLVVERGYVAHRVTETVELDLGTDDGDSLPERDGGWHGESRAQAASTTSWSVPSSAGRRRHHRADDDDDEYHMTIAFPALRSSGRSWRAEVRAGTDADTVGRLGITARVDDASAADERRERGAIVARAAARAAAKHAVVKAVRDKKGEVAGNLANFGASLLERADVRSWHLLPSDVTLVRLRLPAGVQQLRLRIGEGALARTVEAGTVRVRAGGVEIVPVRLWQAPPVPVAPSDSPQPSP